jgi:hypothetical protein
MIADAPWKMPEPIAWAANIVRFLTLFEPGFLQN